MTMRKRMRRNISGPSFQRRLDSSGQSYWALAGGPMAPPEHTVGEPDQGHGPERQEDGEGASGVCAGEPPSARPASAKYPSILGYGEVSSARCSSPCVPGSPFGQAAGSYNSGPRMTPRGRGE
jgi:hypothetical protein